MQYVKELMLASLYGGSGKRSATTSSYEQRGIWQTIKLHRNITSSLAYIALTRQAKCKIARMGGFEPPTLNHLLKSCGF